MKHISKYITAVMLLLYFSINMYPAGRMDTAVARFVNSKAMRNAKAGVCVIDITTGEVVASANRNTPMIPASVTKLITSATALKALTPGYQFKTSVTTDGKISANGTLNGNLIINGGIDPTLESRYFPEHESFIVRTIQELKKRGIKRIYGKVIVNSSVCPEPGVPARWEDADVVEDYGAGIYALNYSDNRCSLIFDVSGKNARIIDTLPHQRNLRIRNNVRIVRGKNGRWTPAASRRKNTNTITVSGAVRRQNNLVELKTTTPDPADALTCDLTEAIVCEGIPVMNKTLKPRKGRTALFTYTSPRLEEIVASLLKRSDNMYAEAVLRAIALKNGFTSSREIALQREQDILKIWGINYNGQTIYDGSGLSRSNRYSPYFLASIIYKAAVDHTIGQQFPALLPVCGYEGTVKSLMKGTALEGKIVLKSGSMNGVQCYAGYYPAGRPRYAVVMMANGFRCNYGTLKSSIERLLLNLFC